MFQKFISLLKFISSSKNEINLFQDFFKLCSIHANINSFQFADSHFIIRFVICIREASKKSWCPFMWSNSASNGLEPCWIDESLCIILFGVSTNFPRLSNMSVKTRGKCYKLSSQLKTKLPASLMFWIAILFHFWPQ